MDRLDSVSNILDNLARALDEPDLDPDAARTDWPALAARVAQVRSSVNDRLFLDFAATLEEDEAAGKPVARAREVAAGTVAEVAALCLVAGHGADAKAVLDVAWRLAPRQGGVRDELDAARDHGADHAALVRARWLLRKQREGAADAILKRLARGAADPRLRAGATAALDAPRPLTGGAPPLFRVNGFGAGLYGERDRHADGSYVTTYCVSAAFVPVFPIRAYRVRRQGDGWVVLARTRLSRFARGARAVLLGGLVLGGAAAAHASWAGSPAHLAAVALDAARSEERAHHDDAALRGYEAALRTYAGDLAAGDRAAAALAFARLSERGVREPATVADADHIVRAVRRYEALNLAPQAAAAAEFARALGRWMDQIGDATPAAALAVLRLAEVAPGVAPAAERAAFDGRRDALHRTLAARAGVDWPLEALPHYLAIGGAAGAREALPAVDVVLASPALTLAAEPQLAAWLGRAADDPALAPRATEAQGVLAAAHALADDPERRHALETGDPAALGAWAAAHPGDQDVAAALALQLRHEVPGGAPDETLRRLAPIGPPGLMAPAVRLAYAQALTAAGRAAEADAVLTRTLETRLPVYQGAQRAWSEALVHVEEELVAGARAGALPPEVAARMNGRSEAEQRQVFQDWMRDQLRASPALRDRRAALERVSDVVPMALTLGTLKLRRADEVDGATRTRMLGEAERLFLAIREQAEGTPEFRLGLGQVYHRLGRAAEGDREFNALLAGGDAAQKLAVAGACRDLGLADRARAIGEAVYGSADGDARGAAALLMSVMAETPEDAELWLRRGPADSPEVQARLREVEGQRLLRDGRFAEADRAFADAAERFGRDAATDGAAANNQALAEFARFGCTGDLGLVQTGVRSLELARRHNPANAIGAYNLGAALLYQGHLRVLGGFARVNVLRPSTGEAAALVDALTAGSQREAVLAALRRDPSIRQGVEVLRQASVLSPEGTAAYQAEADQLGEVRDLDGLRALHARLARVAHLDTTEYARWTSRWQAGTADAEILRRSDATLAQAARAVADAERARHAPTLALARGLQAAAALRRVTVTAAAADARAAAAAARRATGTWDGAGYAYPLAVALVHGAVLSSLASNDALRRAYEAERRSYPLDQLLLRLRESGGAGVAALAALRAQPDVDEALGLLRTAAAREPGIAFLLYGRALGDDALVAAVRPVLADEARRLAQAIDARLQPSPAARERLDLFGP